VQQHTRWRPISYSHDTAEDDRAAICLAKLVRKNRLFDFRFPKGIDRKFPSITGEINHYLLQRTLALPMRLRI
jgi:exonuclease I